MSIATGTAVFLVALAVILAFGATMIWQTFRDTKRRHGSETDAERVKRRVHGGPNRRRHDGAWPLFPMSR